jgi:hypothetical protein
MSEVSAATPGKEAPLLAKCARNGAPGVADASEIKGPGLVEGLYEGAEVLVWHLQGNGWGLSLVV